MTYILPVHDRYICTWQNVSASAAERNWSVYGQIVTPARSCMQHKRADKLVYCHEALHMRSKLQGAGYEQEVVKWDSDSDSDESDDEQDLIDGLSVSTCV